MKRLLSQSMRCWVLVLCLAVASQVVAAKNVIAKPTSGPCDVSPIALSLASVSNIQTGTVFSTRNGADAGDFGWLTWTGNRSQGALAKSLHAPGDSHTYVNP